MKILDVPQSGSLAGTTSSRNRNGQYRRTRATPVNPNSTAQITARARLATNAAAWKSLTATQREGWQTLGAYFTRTDSLGQVYNMTGFQAYISVNNNQLNAGNAVLSDAPFYDIPNAIDTVTPTITAASYSVAYTVTPLLAGERIFISAGPQRSPGVGFEGDYRLIAVSAAAAASPFNLLATYVARFGTPVVGAKIFTSVQRYMGGFLSVPIATSTIVA